MSHGANEFEEPGANYPDSAQAAPAPTGTQDAPALDQNLPTDMERLDGVVQQVRADVGGEDVAIVEKSLRRRLTDTGIVVADDEVSALARDIAG
ncbi:hypothetical protein LJR045_002479 [Microbacterium sp. LjRoot45]|uniref:hypothetical protein n=1 Tax=Microbacterium sp. LjRoot45 TaxID=3342329 RepID=UPI003ED0A1C4